MSLEPVMMDLESKDQFIFKTSSKCPVKVLNKTNGAKSMVNPGALQT